MKPASASPPALRTWSVFDGFQLAQRQAERQPPSWSVFDGFTRPRPAVSWMMLDNFVSHGHRFAVEQCRALPDLLERWNMRLRDLGDDPSRTDWSHFRPLRTDREEGWSDWLQHFIATSTSGTFAHQLFSHCNFPDAAHCIHPQVRREEVIDDRRADLVVRWANGDHTHVEVKVGDQNFSKTSDTAQKLERKHPGTWTHYILLLAGDLERWNGVDRAEKPVIHVLTWDDVAIALRRCLQGRADAPRWLWWAHGFCGVVEQQILGHPVAGNATESLRNLERRVHQISIMKRGLDDV